MKLASYVRTLELLGDESRLRLCALLRERELTVSELVRVTGIAQSRVSTHLGRLREGGLVRDRRDGQHAYYTLAEQPLPPAAQAVLEEARSSGDPLLHEDVRRLAELDAERRGGAESYPNELERHYSPGRTWESLAVGLSALLKLGDVLDVGCGDGAAAAHLAPSCRTLTCVDASERMVAAASERLASFAGVTVRQGDAHALPFEEASFDTAVLFHTLTYAERPQRVVQECARVLRPEGRLVVLALDEHEHGAVTSRFGERHRGFSPERLEGFFKKAGLRPGRCGVACREARKPHFRLVLAVAEKRGAASESRKARTH